MPSDTDLDVHVRAALFEAQKKVLEKGARGAEIGEVLGILCREVEELIDPGTRCSILYTADGRLSHGAAPSLPEAYVAALEGVQIGPSVGSCGTSAFRGEKVFVEDIQSSPLWEDYKSLAAEHELKACWSTPVFGPYQSVIATFAVYPGEASLPTRKQAHFVEAFSDLAGIVIGRATAEAKLAAEKRRLSSVIEGTEVGAWEWRPATDEAFVTERWADVFGRTVEELEPISLDTWQELIHPDDRPDVLEALQVHLRGDSAFFESEYRGRHKDERWVWVEVRGRITKRDEDGNPEILSGTHQDITEKKQQERALRQNERDLRLTLDSIADGVITADSEGRVSRMNAAAEHLTGWSLGSAWGRDASEILPFLEDRLDTLTTKANSDRDTPAPLVKGATASLRTPAGREYDLSYSITPMFASTQSSSRIVISFRDVTEEHRMQQELRRSEELLERTNRLARVGGWEYDVQTQEVWFSDEAKRIYDMPLDDEIDFERGIELMQDNGSRRELEHALERAIEYGEPFELEAANSTMSGRDVWIQSTGMPVMEEGTCVRVHGALQNITKRKEAEEALQRMQRLESLGRLAGGIAHDFNNILMGFYGSITFARERIAEDHPAHAELDDAEHALDRAKRLTGQLLTFAKGGDPVKEHVSLGEVVEEVVQFDLSGSNVKPVFEIADELRTTEADQGQIQQVFSNLVINARESMNKAGHVYVSLENVVADAASGLPLAPGNYLRARIRDEGPGIDAEYVDRIFDPYFSCKEQGRGLGLATVYSIIQKHDGHIDVSSKVGEGTEFTLYLPATDEPVAPDDETDSGADSGQPQKPSKPARILVIDDEPAIRRVSCRMLERLGHEAQAARDGLEGLDVYRRESERGHPFDLVIMDITIPGGIGGKEALERLLEFDPSARAIASTGYADDPVLAKYEDYGFAGIAPKPYTLAELEDILNGVL